MAYKFSLGKYKHSGSLVSADSLTVSSGSVALPAGVISNTELENSKVTINGYDVALGAALTLDTKDLASFSGSVQDKMNAYLAGNKGIAYSAGGIAIDFSEFSTTDVVEGTKLFYTDARARAAVSAQEQGLTYSSGSGQFALVLDGTGLAKSASGLKLDLEAEVAAASGSGSLAVDNATGKITLTPASPVWAKGLFSAADTAEIDMSYADGVYSADIKAGSIQNAKIADATIANAKLVNSKVTVNGHDIALGGAYTLDTVDLASFSGSVQDKMNAYLQGGAGLAYAAGNFDVNVAGGIKILSDSVALHTGAVGDGLSAITGAVADAVAKFAVVYGSTAKTAVQGNQTWQIAAGGGLTGDSNGVLGSGLSATLGVGAGNGIEVLTDTVAVKLSSSDALLVNGAGLDLKATINGSRTFQNDLTINGNLYVNGGTFSASVGTLLVEDSNITIADGAGALAAGQGFTVGSGLATFQVGDGSSLNSAFVSSLELKAPKFVGSMVGSITEGIQSVSAPDAATKSIVLCDAASAGFTLTLPAASAWVGMSMKVKKSDLTENAVAIAAAGSEKIDGISSIVLDSPYAAVMLVSNGSNWFVF